MSAPSTITAQVGIGDESTPGLAVTPTVFFPALSEEIERNDTPLESDAVYAGRLTMDEDSSNGGNIEIAGSLGLELTNRAITKLFKHMFGAANDTGSGPYTHTYTPADLTGMSATIQTGIPTTAGVVQPKTSAGCKVSSWEVAGQVGEIITLGTDWVAMRQTIGSRSVTDGVTTNADATVTSSSGAFAAKDLYKPISGTGIPTGAYIAAVNSSTSIELSVAATADGTGLTIVIGKALASASYLSDIKPYKLHHARLLIAGSEVEMKGFTLAGDNQIEGRWFAGDRNSAEPLSNGNLRDYTGTIDLEYASNEQVERYFNEEKFALVVSATNGADSVTFTTNCRYNPGGAPKFSGRGLAMQQFPIKCLGSGTDASAITAVVVNSDAAA